MLPDTRRGGRKESWTSKKLDFDPAVQVRPVYQHGNQLVSTERLDDLDKREFICAHRDRLDPETLAILLAPFIELIRRLRHRDDVDWESVEGQGHSAELPRSEMTGT